MSCTIVVVDRASLERAMDALGPDEVVCVRGRSSGSAARSSSTRPTAGADSSAGADSTARAEPTTGNKPDGAASSPAGPGTPDQTNCTKEITDGAGVDQALSSVRPGDKICVKADDIGIRLEISIGGSADSPVQVVGTGATATKGITVKADNVVVDGFTADQPSAPGIEITGNGVTVRNNTVTKPTGGDGDGLRFFGNDINILHNRIAETDNSNGHADCMQTFTSGRPSSENVLIEGNQCEKIANICLMAEGPGDVGDGGGGDGTSANWTLTDNTCEFGAAQGYMIEAVQNVTMTNNEFTGSADKAIGLDVGATGAKVEGNKLNGIANEVGMDSSSKEGYQGPDPGTGP